MKLSSNYTYHRGWDIEEFEVNEKVHLQAIKDGTTIAIQGSLKQLVEILDAVDNTAKLWYNDNNGKLSH